MKPFPNALIKYATFLAQAKHVCYHHCLCLSNVRFCLTGTSEAPGWDPQHPLKTSISLMSNGYLARGSAQTTGLSSRGPDAGSRNSSLGSIGAPGGNVACATTDLECSPDTTRLMFHFHELKLIQRILKTSDSKSTFIAYCLKWHHCQTMKLRHV
jgi:hypothetical protein